MKIANSVFRERTRRDFLSLAGKSLGLAAFSSATVASLLKTVSAAKQSVAHLTPEVVASTLGCVVKDESDLRRVRAELEAGRLPAGAA